MDGKAMVEPKTKEEDDVMVVVKGGINRKGEGWLAWDVVEG
jgi:hypothetical protein